MKKILALMAVVIFLASCSQDKIAYADVNEILSEYEGAKKAEEEIRAKSTQMTGELEQLYMGFQQKVQEFQTKSASLSSSARQEQEQALRMEQQQLEQRRQMAQQQIQMEGEQVMGKIQKEIDDFLIEYAEKQGYSYILGTSPQTQNVLYGKQDLDITEDIIDALNVDYDSASANTEESKPVVETEKEGDSLQ